MYNVELLETVFVDIPVHDIEMSTARVQIRKEELLEIVQTLASMGWDETFILSNEKFISWGRAGEESVVHSSLFALLINEMGN